MIDLHCHLLPNVDDGARDLPEALAMAELAVEQGVTHAVLTPHIHTRHYQNTLSSLQTPFLRFQQALEQQGVALRILLGGEIRIAPELLLGHLWEAQPYIGQCVQGKRVLLLEMPHSHVPAGTEQLLRWLQSQGVQPLLAHPERNREIIAKPNIAQLLVQHGAWLQGTLAAFDGSFGQEAEAVAWLLLENNQYHVLASDAHRLERRPPRFTVALERLHQRVGAERVHLLTEHNPWQIICSRISETSEQTPRTLGC